MNGQAEGKKEEVLVGGVRQLDGRMDGWMDRWNSEVKEEEEEEEEAD